MSEFVGADPRQLTELAKTMVATADTWQGIPAAISGQLARCGWSGRDADTFRDAWKGPLTRSLDRAVEKLREGGSVLVRNAIEQDLASGSFDAASYGALLEGESWSDVINTIQGLFQGEWNADDSDYITVSDPASIPVDGPAAQQVMANLDQVNQGSIGDCWLISALASVGATNPQWIDDHITYVDGGWEVTLYVDGEPVTQFVPADGLTNFGARDASGQVSWMSIYEQAVAQQLGGDPVDYNSLVADSTTRGFELITGSAGSESIFPPSIQDLEAAVTNGQPITAMTDPIHPWRDDLVAAHVYIVTDVDAEAGTVTVVNPWGTGPQGKEGEIAGTLTMSYEDYQANFIMTGVGEKTT